MWGTVFLRVEKLVRRRVFTGNAEFNFILSGSGGTYIVVFFSFHIFTGSVSSRKRGQINAHYQPFTQVRPLTVLFTLANCNFSSNKLFFSLSRSALCWLCSIVTCEKCLYQNMPREYNSRQKCYSLSCKSLSNRRLMLQCNLKNNCVGLSYAAGWSCKQNSSSSIKFSVYVVSILGSKHKQAKSMIFHTKCESNDTH